jgi:hypothetical protein
MRWAITGLFSFVITPGKWSGTIPIPALSFLKSTSFVLGVLSPADIIYSIVVS